MSKITIYSTKTCGFCKMLKGYLDDKGIKYESKMADEDPKLAQELYDISGQLGVPFTIIETDEGETFNILGFDKLQIDHALKLS